MASSRLETAKETAVLLLQVAEEIPPIDKVAKLIHKIIQICDQSKCNKDASQALQERFCRVTEHLFAGEQSLVGTARSMPDNASLIAYCVRMECILQAGTTELERYNQVGFLMSFLKGSKPQETFERLDREMTQCLNELSVTMGLTALREQAKIYNVVCNIESKVEDSGGPEGLLANRADLESLAVEMGASVDVMKSELRHWLKSLSALVSVVDENVTETKEKVGAVHQAVMTLMSNQTPDITGLQLTSHPVIDRKLMLGEGVFGMVFKGVYDHVEVAVKEVNIHATRDKEFKKEVAMHHKVGNLPGVVRIFGANFTTVPRYIVLELAAGTLHDALHKNNPAIDRSLPSKLSLLAQVCSTMSAISNMGILHRDLKSSNVLLFFNNNRVYAKVSDFGLTRMANDQSSTGGSAKGTLPYMAPEVFRGKYSSASDMYAFAVMLNEVLSEQVPFPGCSYVEIVQSVGTFRQRPDRFQANVGDKEGRELMTLTERCWHQDPVQRMSFHELAAELNHLLRKAAELARVGFFATELNPPRASREEIEASILALTDWLHVSCHLAETDAHPLAHTLVTVKQITSVPLFTQALLHDAEFLTKELSIATPHKNSIMQAVKRIIPDGTTFALRSFQDTYISVRDGGDGSQVDLVRNVEVGTLWTFVHIHDNVYGLLSSYGTYLRAHTGGEGAVVDMAPHMLAYENWTVVSTRSGKYAFRSAHGQYLRANADLGIADQHEFVGDWNFMTWEQFELILVTRN